MKYISCAAPLWRFGKVKSQKVALLTNDNPYLVYVRKSVSEAVIRAYLAFHPMNEVRKGVAQFILGEEGNALKM